MTIRELADVAGCSYSTIYRESKALYPGKLNNGMRTVFDESESVRIMAGVRKRGFVSPMQNEKVPRQNEKVEKLKLILNAPALKELIRIYGQREAAKRIDHLIGFPTVEIRIEPPARKHLPVPVEDVEIFFSRIRGEIDRIEAKKKQRELFPEEELA